MSLTDNSAFNDAIDAEVVSDTKTPTKEYYRLPLKRKNEITVSIKASNNASILLFDGSKSSDASDIKVEIVLGSDNNTTASIGLSKIVDKYPNQLIQKQSVLSATHYKRFNIRWANGRVMVYNDGFTKPFITWDGPPETLFGNIGVRTLGCSGSWIVQGMKPITTADSNEYHEIVINSGRLDFEVRAAPGDAVLLFHPDAKWDTGNILHACFGFTSNTQLGLFWNWGTCVLVNSTSILSATEYHRFWVKWDAFNFWIGRGGSDAAIAEYRTPTTPLPQLNYFSLMAHTSDFACFHILDQVRPDDTKEGSAAGDSAGNDVGYLVYQYKN